LALRGCFGGARLLSLKRLRSSLLAWCFSLFVGKITSECGVTVGLDPPKATKLGLRYEFAMEWLCPPSARPVEDSDSSSELEPSLSSSSITPASSLEHSAMSRSMDSCAIGELGMKDELKGDFPAEARRREVLSIGCEDAGIAKDFSPMPGGSVCLERKMS
jgi:hypothetical protein